MTPSTVKNLQTIRDFIRFTTTSLYRSKATFMHGYDNPEDEATFLVMKCLSLPLEDQERFIDCRVTEEEKEILSRAIDERCNELIPTAYITKEWWLTGHPFYVDDRVLIPRSYIAELLEEELSPWIADPENVFSVLDLCTGSGCLAIIAAETFPNATVDAADISIDALDVARINIADYNLDEVVSPIRTDVFSNLQGKKYDLIISNPPYVTSQAMQALPGEYCHEPALALAAGDDGMDIVKKIISQAKSHLNDGGLLVVEIGNGKDAFEALYPEIPVMWLTTSGGDDQVFLVKKEDLP